ncbi:hypothetical protein MMC34_004979 [Xylographa carneopallida]|nr:hypothetical protein [Xylographa carneopallida]
MDGNTFFTGTVFTICIISIPLRLQAVNGVSPLDAGIRLLPYGVLVPVGAFTAAIIAGRTKIPSVPVLSFGAALQMIGLALLSSLPTSGGIRTASYGFEVLAGYGTGLSIGTLVMLTPIVAEKRDLAVATAAINQFRFMGGSIGLALVTSIMFSSIRPSLLLLLPAAQVNNVLQTTSSITSYTPELQTSIREVFGTGFDLQMKITAGLAAGEVLGAGIMWTGIRRRK